jgi:hypothetical protein
MSIATFRPRRMRAGLALVTALLLAAMPNAVAAARPSSSHRGSCPAHRAKHAAKHCAKHHAKKHGGARKAKKPAHKPVPPVPLTPAICEEGAVPARSAAGSYSCEDGSAPFCEDGSEPVRPSAASAPMCRVPKEEAGRECSVGASGECEAELVCEDAEEAVAVSQGCEHGSAFEEGEAEA